MENIDLLVFSRGPWITLDAPGPGPRSGAEMNQMAQSSGLAVAIRGDRIEALGPLADLRQRYQATCELDWGDLLVMPGFVDPHTHPVFNASREAEFEMRNQGRSYVEIAKAGGGIRSSVRSLREASEDELVAKLRIRADRFLELGTTTLEAKSGYGLSTEDELKSLRAIRRVAESHPLGFVPTFLGAHEIPDEWRDDRESYINLIINEMIPAVASEGLAVFCDVFCEEHVFNVDESRRILMAARAAGLRARLHADEIESTGGAELAAEVDAISADHLVAISDQGIEDLKAAGTIPVLLPGTSFFLNLPSHAPARRMIDAGLPIALATDYNPGSCHTQSMPMIMTLASINYGLSTAEIFNATTVNAAASLGLAADRGRLAPGLRADLIAIDAPSPQFLPYQFGNNIVRDVVKNGQHVVHQGQRIATNHGNQQT